MEKKLAAAIMLALFFNAYADDNVPSMNTDTATINKGAQEYDWQTCIDAKSSGCINNCATSEEINCKDNCLSIAKDKCLSEGYSPPE